MLDQGTLHMVREVNLRWAGILFRGSRNTLSHFMPKISTMYIQCFIIRFHSVVFQLPRKNFICPVVQGTKWLTMDSLFTLTKQRILFILGHKGV